MRAEGRRVLTESLAPWRGAAAALIVADLLGVTATLLIPASVADAVDAATNGDGPGRPLAQVAVLLLITGVGQAFADLLGSQLGASLTARLRHRILRAALALGPPAGPVFPAGEVLSRFAVNASGPANYLPVALSALSTALLATGAVIGLAVIDWRLAALLLLGVPAAALLVRVFLGRASAPSVHYQQLQARIVTRLLGAARGSRTVHAAGTLDRETARVLAPLPDLHRTGRKLWLVQGATSRDLRLLTPALQVLVLAAGGFGVAGGRITPGELIAAGSYTTMAIGAVGLADAVMSALGTLLGAGRVGEVLRVRPTVTPPAEPVPLPTGSGRIEFRGVTVRLGGRTVLDNVDLHLPGGTRAAVVGRSGSGKSLLVALAGRLLDPDDGAVLLDGVPVHRLAPATLRRAVRYAFERPAPLGATVRETIRYGLPDTAPERVRWAAAAARADGFIRRLPDGYDTPLERAPLSGGELQRLGLARALVADARVLILDDALSSLDTATEVEVSRALDTVLTGRTSVLVTHRRAAAARADLVIWLDGGRVRATGRHTSLWADPDYRALFGPDGTGPDGMGPGGIGPGGMGPGGMGPG